MNYYYTELSQEIHKANVNKGFWDERRNTGELFMLIISEVAEALEAHRKGKVADVQAFQHEKSINADGFMIFIKDSFEDEIADVFIRTMDYMGFKNFDIHTSLFTHVGNVADNVGESLCDLCQLIIKARLDAEHNSPNLGFSLHQILAECSAIAIKNNFDLLFHVKEKLKYNANRPYKHGKNY